MTAVVVAIVMGATLGVIQAAGRTGADQRHRAEAYSVAQKDQARLRTMKVSALDGLSQTRTVAVGETNYTVKSTSKFVNDVTGDSTCDEGTNSSDYLSISSTVSWSGMGATPPTVIKSIVAPPNGSLADDKGALAVVIEDATGAGVPGLSMSGTGAGAFSGSTGPTGCVLFTNLPEGNYTLTPNAASGYVDPDGNSPTGIATSVVAQSTNTVVLTYDTPGFIKVNFKTRINGSVQATTGDTISLFNTGMTSSQAMGTVGTRVSSLTTGKLFPFTSPYGVYAGSCTANNPDPTNTHPASVAGALAQLTVTKNQTITGDIQLPALDLSVKTGNSSSNPGNSVSNGTVKITDNNCVVGGTAVKRTYTTTSTAAPGGAGHLAPVGSPTVAVPGLPFGNYSICAYNPNTNRRNTISSLDVKSTTTNASATIYTGTSATGSQSGTCP